MSERGSIEVVTLRGPDGNRLESNAIRALAERLRDVSMEGRVCVVVLTGADSDFCAGRLGDQSMTSAETIREDLEPVVRVNRLMASSPAVFVSAVEGMALGFGCGLAVQSDITVAARNATFGFPELVHGIPPLLVMSYITRYLPLKVALDLLLTGRRISATEARSINMVSELTASGDALQHSMAIAEVLARHDRTALRTLRTFARRVSGHLDDAWTDAATSELAHVLAAKRVSDLAGR